MGDRFRASLGDSGEVFEWNGQVYHRYNAKMKVAGDSVKVCFYQQGVLSGWAKNTGSKTAQGKEDEDQDETKEPYDPERRFEQTGKKARVRLYDFVACNLGKHRDHRGKKQSFKFLTLTFRNDVKHLPDANRLFKDFVKRLNYHFTGEKGSTFLEYVAVPELQLKNERYVWHFHVLIFNMPFIPVSGEMVDQLVSAGRLPRGYDKRDTLFYIWGNGSVDVARVKFSDGYDVAGYISKYVGKGLEGVYEYACDEGLLNRKRFLHSKGLFGPKIMIAFLNREQRQEIRNFFLGHAKKCKRKGELQRYFETWLIDSEWVGKVFGINCRAPMKHVETMANVFEQFSYGFA